MYLFVHLTTEKPSNTLVYLEYYAWLHIFTLNYQTNLWERELQRPGPDGKAGSRDIFEPNSRRTMEIVKEILVVIKMVLSGNNWAHNRPKEIKKKGTSKGCSINGGDVERLLFNLYPTSFLKMLAEGSEKRESRNLFQYITTLTSKANPPFRR